MNTKREKPHGRSAPSTRCRALIAVAIVAASQLGPPSRLAAQVIERDTARATLGRVKGVVFDSLLLKPLAGASVTVFGVSRATHTDTIGAFLLDSVPAGRQFVTFSHPALDSIGLTLLGAVVDVAPGAEALARLATPSLHTFAARLCRPAREGVRSARADSGIVFGIITDADSARRLDGASVTVSWLSLEQTGQRRLQVVMPSVVVETDSTGAYHACGVATGVLVTVQASGGPFTSGETELMLDPRRPMIRHDLLAGHNEVVPLSNAVPAADRSRDARDAGRARSTTSPTVLRGTATLIGVVLDTLANPWSGARVVVLGTTATHTTTESGRFHLTGLPSGSHTLEVRALGAGLERQIVELRSGDTTWVDVTMHPATVLREVRVSARMPLGADRNGFERRRRMGTGHYMTAEKMNAIPYLSGVFKQMPGVRLGEDHGLTTLRMRSGFGWCEPYVFIDGVRAHADALLGNFRPADLVAVEVYTRGFFAPAEFFLDEKCGVVVAWTKAAKW